MNEKVFLKTWSSFSKQNTHKYAERFDLQNTIFWEMVKCLCIVWKWSKYNQYYLNLFNSVDSKFSYLYILFCTKGQSSCYFGTEQFLLIRRWVGFCLWLFWFLRAYFTLMLHQCVSELMRLFSLNKFEWLDIRKAKYKCCIYFLKVSVINI